jgi:mpaB/rubber oxygenase-like protein
MKRQERPVPPEALLHAMQWMADPPADDAIAAMLLGAGQGAREKLAEDLNKVMSAWQDNGDVDAWQPDGDTPPAIAGPLLRFVTEARKLPDWADPKRLACAEDLFDDYGALSVTILFCASLPECYVVPDLAAVLHATGQLEKRTELRIRKTGAMVFPVMMEGGFTSPTGGAVAQILKVRLIHAMVRNLILRAPPDETYATWHLTGGPEGAARVPPLAAIQPGDSMSHALHVRGWDLEERGLPNNQEQLAYTLLTFSYVFLRSMRRLGNRFTRYQEESYLHAWNVAGHVLGIHRDLQVDNMKNARALFRRMQARGRDDWKRRPEAEDPRHGLGKALMDAMKAVTPKGPFQAFPILLTRRLIGRASSKDLGLERRVSLRGRFAFWALMGNARVVDWLMRLAFANFSISRLITRAIGYRLTCTLLMNETLPLSVPDKLRPGIYEKIRGWGVDPKASTRMNDLEDRATTAGDWLPLQRPPRPEARKA